MSKLILLFVFAFMVLAVMGYAYAAECQDHIDNDGDGYCDASTIDGYCEDGSQLGDAKCSSLDSSEVNCIPSQEICDGIDNNCNSVIDEDLQESRMCGIGIGECRQGSQARECSLGQWSNWGECSGAVYPTAEICGNGKDDNCNSVIDDECGSGSPANPVIANALAIDQEQQQINNQQALERQNEQISVNSGDENVNVNTASQESLGEKFIIIVKSQAIIWILITVLLVLFIVKQLIRKKGEEGVW